MNMMMVSIFVIDIIVTNCYCHHHCRCHYYYQDLVQ